MTFQDPDWTEDAQRHLVDGFLRRATVRIQDPTLGLPTPGEDERLVWGSGFFVAPGLVLTAAHVLWPSSEDEDATRGDGPIGIALPDRVVTGTWVAALPERRGNRVEGALPPWPDLALIRVHDTPAGAAGATDAAATDAAASRGAARTASARGTVRAAGRAASALRGGAAAPPCVWLTERAPATGRAVVSVGYAAVYHTHYAPWQQRGSVTGVAGSAEEPLFQIDASEVPSGTSGGPVLDLAGGAVWAVNTAKRSERRPGGVVTPVSALRALADGAWPGAATGDGAGPGPGYEVADGVDPVALFRELWHGHDGHHWHAYQAAAVSGAPSWLGLAGALDGDGARRDVALLAKLRSELATLPPAEPGLVLGIVEDKAALLPALRRLPVLWRDGLDLLVVRCPDSTVWIDYCERARAAGAASPGGSVATRGRQAARVVLRIDADRFEEDCYHWSVVREQAPGRGWPCGKSTEAVPQDQLAAQIFPVLVRALVAADQGAEPAVIEVCLPLELFDLAVDEWFQEPDPASKRHTPWSLPLGLRHPVVVRDAEREGLPWEAGRAQAQLRWSALQAQAPVALPVDPKKIHDYESALRLFDLADRHAVPVWPERAAVPPGSFVLDAAAVVGIPVMLWRRRSGHASATEFLNELATLVDRHSNSGQLGPSIQQLRKDVFHARQRGHWAEGVVLLYDSPGGRPSPPAQLTPLE